MAETGLLYFVNELIPKSLLTAEHRNYHVYQGIETDRVSCIGVTTDVLANIILVIIRPHEAGRLFK
jgi:hypothetical protein